MTQFRKSVPKPAPGAGSPKGKSPNATIIYADDVIGGFIFDETGVRITSNILLKVDAKFHRIYMTDVTQKVTATTEGDPDAEGFIKKFEGMHPGDQIELTEFLEKTLGQGFIILYDADCGSNMKRLIGTPCNPLYIKANFEDSKDKLGTELVFEARRRDRHLIKFYEGTLQFDAPTTTTDETVVITEANGGVYRLAPSSVASTEVTIDTMSQPHGSIVSLVGQGGSNPMTLPAGVNGPVTVLLKDGTAWTALENAAIHLKVFDAGATTYLIEQSRA